MVPPSSGILQGWVEISAVLSNCRDLSPGVRNDSLLQYSCLENSMDRGAWRGAVHGGHKESDTAEAT